MRLHISHIVLITVLLFGASLADANVDPVSRQRLLEIHEAVGKKIQEVQFSEGGIPDSLRQKFQALQGQKFEANEISRVVQWFHETQGDSRLEVSFEIISKNSIRLVVTYKARKKIQSIKLAGNQALSETRYCRYSTSVRARISIWD